MGRGLHTGLKVMMSIMPAEPSTGIEFVRRDVTHCNNIIPARWDCVSDTQLSTTVSNALGIRVSAIEHLMAALRAAGVDNAYVVLDAPEVPIMDGSAAPFLNLIAKTGTTRQSEERRVIAVHRAVGVTENRASASCIPSVIPWLDLSIDFSERLIGRQSLSMAFSGKTFSEEISQARAFGFEKQLKELKRRGFARGSSLENAILVDGNKVVNCGGLRYSDEFVRHKYANAVGDLALAGHYIIGHFKGHKSGHRLNNLLLRKLFASGAWTMITMREAHQAWQKFAGIQISLSPSISA